MKYLKKLFEKENEKYWIVVIENLKDSDGSIQELFDDEESAENYFIEIVNDEKERKFEFLGKDFTLNDIFIDRTKAEDWLKENVFDLRIYYYGIHVQGKCEESERVKLAKQTRKFNI